MPGPAHRCAKRTVDLVVTTVVLVVVSPLMLVIAAAIRLSDPRAACVFRQQRTGQGGRPFTVLKFRTMDPEAEARKDALRARSEVAWPDFRLHDDPRVTRLGAVLRRTSLDELPQLFNVLRGDMSLVGPRPTSFAASTYEPWQLERLEVRPGLTGPWQLDGRDSMDFEARCRMEIDFLRHPSLRRDVVLILRTPLAILRGTGVA